MPKILAIDSSTDACSAALLLGDEIYDRFKVTPKEHTSFILPMVNELLSKAKLDFKQLDAIAFGCGPGSFTGVRLAASVAQGFAFASGLPVLGISTLRVLAQEVFAELRLPKVLVAQDAKMQEIYWGEYKIDSDGIMQSIIPDKLIKPSEANFVLQEGFVGVGSGFIVYKDFFTQIRVIDKQYVQAKYLVQLAASDFTKGIMVTAKKALPIYLREKVV